MFFFLTGTDEHGQKIERAAKENNKTPLIFCNEISKTFLDLTKTLNLSNNDFIRTTEERHKKSGIFLKKKVKFICLNIQDGIQYPMKLFIMMMN